MGVTCAPWQCPACSCGYGLPSCRRVSPPQQQEQACQTRALVTSAVATPTMMAGSKHTPATVTGTTSVTKSAMVGTQPCSTAASGLDPHQEACIWPELAPPEMCDLPNNCTMATTTPPPTTTPMTCPLPCQTVQNGACYPECCEDEDCSGGLCDSGGSCQLGDCRRGSDCTGYNTLCHEPWQQGADNCEYCDNMDTNQEIGSCQPGCESSDHNMCPPANGAVQQC